jgi:hypothetical protein
MEMTMRTRKELTRTVAKRYIKASRTEKQALLDEFCKNTQYNRDYAASLLRAKARAGTDNQQKSTERGKKSGRPSRYDAETVRILVKLWKMFDRLCGKRLVVFIRSGLPTIRSVPFLHITAEQEALLSSISGATIDRLLKPTRKKDKLRGHCYTRPSQGLKESIPVRTFGEWDASPPGHCQIDTVGHDGGFLSQECSFSLCLTEISSGWTERYAMQNRAFKWVHQGLAAMKTSVPFPLLHLHPDNGSEFINHGLVAWCAAQDPVIELSRSRPGKKNDNCHVEQKNFDTIRKLVGYARYSTQEMLDTLNRLYEVHGLLLNYFYPSQKLISKTRVGSKVRKIYDKPKTPAMRLLENPTVPATVKQTIQTTLAHLDPVALSNQVDTLVNLLHDMLSKTDSSMVQPM